MQGLLSVVFCAVTILLQSAAIVINRDVQRTIDASTSILKVQAEIKVSNANKEYDFAFSNAQAKCISYISVKNKGKSLVISDPIMTNNITIYSIRIAEANPTLKLEVVFTDLLEPFPAEIKQSENQLVKFTDSHYFLSPYRTESQKTIVKLSSSGIESFSKLAPHSVRGSTIIFGAYKEVEPFSYSPATIHYVNNKPFAKFSSMIREVELSHWGNIAIEEVYELKHAGAKLQGGFSRYEYQMKKERSSPSFTTIITTLPISANNIYYRDQIGNISSSDLFTEDGHLQMAIDTRFPMFGGWQTQFYIGYSIPTEDSLFVDSSTGRYKLKLNAYTNFHDVWVEDMEIKVVLPEGCGDVTVETPYPMDQARTQRFTYLDSTVAGGRPVISLRAKNLVDKHQGEIVISYTFSPYRMVIEPLMLVASFFLFFVFCSLMARLDRAGPGATPAASASVVETGSGSGDAVSSKKID